MGFLLSFWVYFAPFNILDSFHRYTTFGRCDGPKKDRVLGVPLGLFYDLSPWIRHASWMSLGMMVTLLACMAQRLASSRRPTRYASEASCNAIIAPLWNLMFILLRS